jgi:hypothetical protein
MTTAECFGKDTPLNIEKYHVFLVIKLLNCAPSSNMNLFPFSLFNHAPVILLALEELVSDWKYCYSTYCLQIMKWVSYSDTPSVYVYKATLYLTFIY